MAALFCASQHLAASSCLCTFRYLTFLFKSCFVRFVHLLLLIYFHIFSVFFFLFLHLTASQQVVSPKLFVTALSICHEELALNAAVCAAK